MLNFYYVKQIRRETKRNFPYSNMLLVENYHKMKLILYNI